MVRTSAAYSAPRQTAVRDERDELDGGWSGFGARQSMDGGGCVGVLMAGRTVGVVGVVIVAGHVRVVVMIVAGRDLDQQTRGGIGGMIDAQAMLDFVGGGGPGLPNHDNHQRGTECRDMTSEAVERG